MYQVFNMGCRMEFYVPAALAQQIIAMAHAYHIDAWVIGHVEKAATASVELRTQYGTFVYGDQTKPV
jgi:phosphoribosylformylglycinamidine cyclo-ligase